MGISQTPAGQQPHGERKDDGDIQQLDRVETADRNDEILKPRYDKVDEFGAHDKTDPAEIALVRKIDLYCLVCSPVEFLIFANGDV